MISGISYTAYWVSNFVFELIKYYITGGVMVLLVVAFKKYPEGLYALYLLYGIAIVPFTYSVSFFFQDESSAQNGLIFLNFVVGALASSVIFILRVMDSTIQAAKIIAYFLRIFPLFSFAYGYYITLSYIKYLNSDSSS